VDAFKLEEFVGQVRHAGADYVLFTATHALQLLPAPHPVINRILPGRTCQRDLIGELAHGLAAKGIHLLVYYNHSCNGNDDPEWRKAVGYDGQDKNLLAKNLMDIVGWMSERYKDKIKAWWFDGPYSLDPRGPHSSVSTDMTGFRFPWERLTMAAKLGYPARLVTYNAGVDKTFLYTTHQDYWATSRLRPRPGIWTMACNGSAGRAWRIELGCITGQTPKSPSRSIPTRT
jgi:hypothetical protein